MRLAGPLYFVVYTDCGAWCGLEGATASEALFTDTMVCVCGDVWRVAMVLLSCKSAAGV